MTVGLSPDGKIRVYNDRGSVHVIIGVYTAAGAGAQGPAGPAGTAGQPGADGTDALAGKSCAPPLVVVGFDVDGDVVCSSPVDLDGDGFFVDPWNTGLGEPWDCDDTDPTIFPGADEVLDDGIDQDCDGSDAVTAQDCNDANPYTIDTWDALTQSCEHTPQALDLDEDGYTAQQAVGGLPDCDDTDPAINPDAPELPNGIDDNCNGQIDEGL